MDKIKIIERIHKPDRMQFEQDYLSKSKPVVITGVSESWNACHSWNLSYLSSKIGHIDISYRYGDRPIHPDITKDQLQQIKSAKFSEYCDYLNTLELPERSKLMISSQELNFLCNDKVNHDLDILCDDFEIPDYFDQKKLHVIGLWLSARGALSWLHYDGNEAHNLNMQVTGEKFVKLYEPNLANKLDLVDSESSDYLSFSKVDLLSMTDNQKELLDSLPSYQTTLSSSEMLFIPAFWFHSFSHVGETNINVNFWWHDEITPVNLPMLRSKYLQAFWSKVTGSSSPSADVKSFYFNKLPEKTRMLFKQIESGLLQPFSDR